MNGNTLDYWKRGDGSIAAELALFALAKCKTEDVALFIFDEDGNAVGPAFQALKPTGGWDSIEALPED
jgi:hypothetical protein